LRRLDVGLAGAAGDGERARGDCEGRDGGESSPASVASR
jgi:hypothetical protein